MLGQPKWEMNRTSPSPIAAVNPNSANATLRALSSSPSPATLCLATSRESCSPSLDGTYTTIDRERRSKSREKTGSYFSLGDSLSIRSPKPAKADQPTSVEATRSMKTSVSPGSNWVPAPRRSSPIASFVLIGSS